MCLGSKQCSWGILVDLLTAHGGLVTALVDELDNAFQRIIASAVLLTTCLTLMPVQCLQCEDQHAPLWPPPSLPSPSSDDEDVPCNILEPEQVSHNACASAQSSALGASWLICSLHMVAW